MGNTIQCVYVRACVCENNCINAFVTVETAVQGQEGWLYDITKVTYGHFRQQVLVKLKPHLDLF